MPPTYILTAIVIATTNPVSLIVSALLGQMTFPSSALASFTNFIGLTDLNCEAWDMYTILS